MPNSAPIDTATFSSPAFAEALRARDPAAVTAVVNAYTKQLFRASLGLGFNPSGADELVQSVWNTFFEVLPKFKGGSHVRTFLFGILYNKAKELHRDHARYQLHDEGAEAQFDAQFDEDGHWRESPADPERSLLSAEAIDRIQACLKHLPQAQRMAFVLREVEEQETEEICNALSITATNLGVLLFRARNRLRTCLGAHGE